MSESRAMQAITQNINRRVVGDNIWLSRAGSSARDRVERLTVNEIQSDVLESEDAVGRAMLGEIVASDKQRIAQA